MEELNNKKEPKGRLKKVMRPVRYVWYLLILILIIFTTAYLLLRIPSVQNYLAKKTTSILSDRLNTKVEVDRIDINLFKGVELEKFYLEDLSGDTLIYAGSLYSDFYNTIRGFYRKDFNVNALYLENGEINLKRTNKDPLFNIQRLFNQDYDPYTSYTVEENKEEDSANKPKRATIQLSRIHLKNIDFTNVDSLGGSRQKANLTELQGVLDTFKLDDLRFSFSTLDIDGSSFYMNRFEGDTLLRPIVQQPDIKKELEYFVRVKKLNLDKSSLKYVDERNEFIYPEDSFNPFDIDIENLIVQAKDIEFFDPYYFTGSLDDLSLDMNGFSLESLQAERIFLDKRKAGLEGFTLKTDKSTLKDNLLFKYRKVEDWRDFVNKVLLEGDLRNSTIALGDIVYFAPKLRNNTFFRENINQKLVISGRVLGAVNRLNVRNLNAQLGNNLNLRGSFIGRDLTDPDETLLNITLDRLLTDVKTLEKLIPGFKVPENFYKLNSIDFNGRFDGYYQDFVAYGDIITDLGQGDVDMRLNLKNGSKNASYSGRLNLFNFDLQSWSELEDLGKLSLSANVTNGRGFELNTAYAELGGEIIAFDYKGYRYNGIIDAKLEQNHFDGSLKMDDENIDFDFLGNIDFQEEVPLYDFEADIRKINLEKLNLVDSISHVSGVVDIKLKGTTIDNIIGSALGNEIQIVRNQDTLDFGHFAVASTIDKELRTIFVDSDIINGEVVGTYKLTELPDAAIALIKTNYPSFAKSLKFIKEEPKEQVVADFKLELKDASKLISFFTKKESLLENINATGNINYLENKLNFDMDTPSFAFDNMKFDSLDIKFKTKDNKGVFDVVLGKTLLGNLLLTDLELKGAVDKDSIYFNLKTDEFLDSLSNIVVDGVLSPSNDQIFLSLSELKFDVLGENWSLSNNNNLVVGKEYISLTNFILSDSNRSIKIKSINDNKGIQTNIKDLQLFLVNRWINKDNFILNGDVTAEVSFEDIFNLEGLFVKSEITNFKVNDQSLGTMDINVVTDLKNKNLAYDMFLDNYNDELSLNGTYDLVSRYIDARVESDGFPLNFLENFLSSSISKTTGRVFAHMDVTGQITNLETKGKGEVRDGFTRINYLGTEYFFEDAQFMISKNFIDFTGAKLRDSREQVAKVRGGITHKSFRTLGCNVNISSDKFILLNTTEEINPTYYGFAQGVASVDIVGPFTKIKMVIDAKTGEDTKMTMPVSYTNTTRDQSFIPIISRDKFIQDLVDNGNSNGGVGFTGLDLNLILEVTDQAEMTILFDPISGHKLTGIGSGDIDLKLFPSGELKMFGYYNVDRGQYDFALRNFIKKEFIIRNDGKVTWQGDPLNATIDISADYKKLRVPLNIFLAEFIGDNENLESLAQQEEEVLLSVKLTERLLNPKINFDIEFPSVSGELRSLTENKLATLQSDPLGLNNQVFGLLIFNSFIPYDNPIANTNIGSSFNVIVSELLSAQLSAYVSSIFESVLNEDGWIYNVDVDFRIENSDLLTGTNNNNYGLTLNPKFNSDKFDVVLGGDYLSGNTAIDNYVSGDFVIDYYLQEDKKLKIRIYGRSDRDNVNGRFNKIGSGLYARREFSSFKNLRNSFRKFMKDIEKNEQQE